jgi:NADPH:quinone reductase-like Zn-dependent oxidoreductase
LRTLRPGGVLVSAVGSPDAKLAEQAGSAGVRFAKLMVEPDHVGLEALADLVDDGRLVVHLERTFPFDNAAEAHRLIEGGHTTGKVVLAV